MNSKMLTWGERSPVRLFSIVIIDTHTRRTELPPIISSHAHDA